ncbi:plasmid pRiA4b ORF-3 family protein [Arthrobacter cavernae]|uniref:Plasmid pRiA4b ORF-3 family protein n=1 Tax=Arthrobacter cavernae TaxID=2817681 RepID=A0A939HBA2_9MICC|nr:plasmid pRiA4b ORF-3 family protein [Arthrobacter cavernae]MBO1266616.1 plasmid pRiA4b ORF-3 family protein [Arthrobacter cavernae]
MPGSGMIAVMDEPGNVPAFDLRITIAGTDPEIWRRLLLPESVTIPELHEAIQKAFGWQDYHLYGIRTVDRKGQPRVIVGTEEAADELGAEAAAGVVLSELIDPSAAGTSKLEYEYDFGDSWIHEIEQLGPAEIPQGSIQCVDGAMRGPVEDSGGIGGYADLVSKLGDPEYRDHDGAAEWLEGMTGEPASDFDPAAFSLEAINTQLAQLARRLWPGPVSAEDIHTVLRPVQWFLDEASPAGLELTKDGYLKPAIVKAAMTALGWDEDWPGTARQEIHARPVLALREQLQEWKLLRKFKGRLVLTPSGRRVGKDPQALWDYVADRLANPEAAAVKLATRLAVHWLVEGLALSYDKRQRLLQEALNRAGFRMPGGGDVPLDAASDVDFGVRSSLRSLELTDTRWQQGPEVTDAGLKFLLDVQRRLADGGA